MGSEVRDYTGIVKIKKLYVRKNSYHAFSDTNVYGSYNIVRAELIVFQRQRQF